MLNFHLAKFNLHPRTSFRRFVIVNLFRPVESILQRFQAIPCTILARVCSVNVDSVNREFWPWPSYTKKKKRKKLEQEEKNNGEGKQISRNEISPLSQLTTVTYVRRVVSTNLQVQQKGDEAVKRGTIRETIHLGVSLIYVIA